MLTGCAGGGKQREEASAGTVLMHAVPLIVTEQRRHATASI